MQLNMKKIFKYYVKNRFIHLFACWVFILAFCAVNTNPYQNAFIMGIGFILVVFGFMYVEETSEKKPQERLMLNKLGKMI